MDHLISDVTVLQESKEFCFWKPFHVKHLGNKDSFPPALLCAVYEGHVLFSEAELVLVSFLPH